MSPIDVLKTEAAAFEAQEKAAGRVMKHCAALEQVARKHGYESWRACCASLAQARSEAGKVLPRTNPVSDGELKHYRSDPHWSFEMDIPKRWNAFPPVPTNSPYEVIRFASHEDGVHLIIVFRQPHDPKNGLTGLSDRIQSVLAKGGFENFASAETNIGGRSARTLDFDKPQEGGTWSCRHYLVADDTLSYILGFGTSKWEAMIKLFDRIAKTFVIREETIPPPSAPISQ